VTTPAPGSSIGFALNREYQSQGGQSRCQVQLRLAFVSYCKRWRYFMARDDRTFSCDIWPSSAAKWRSKTQRSTRSGARVVTASENCMGSYRFLLGNLDPAFPDGFTACVYRKED
jgi:hypothetical protein